MLRFDRLAAKREFQNTLADLEKLPFLGRIFLAPLGFMLEIGVRIL